MFTATKVAKVEILCNNLLCSIQNQYCLFWLAAVFCVHIYIARYPAACHISMLPIRFAR